MRISVHVSIVTAFLVLYASASAAGVHSKQRELVHGFPPTGPVELSGAPPASKVLRAVERYAVPAWTDLLAMHVAHTLQDASDAPVTVRRKARQDGQEAARAVAKAPADGQTLLLASRAPEETAAGALQPVALVATFPYVFVGSDGGAAFDLRTLESAGLRPERTLIATVSARTSGYMALDVVRRRIPAIQPVAYNGGYAALQAAVAQHAAVAFVPLPSVMPYLGGGRVRVLAVADVRRHGGIPGVPTTAEAGAASVEAIGWFGVFAPAAVAVDKVGRIGELLSRIALSAETRETFSALGVTLEHRPAGAFGIFLASELFQP